MKHSDFIEKNLFDFDQQGAWIDFSFNNWKLLLHRCNNIHNDIVKFSIAKFSNQKKNKYYYEYFAQCFYYSSRNELEWMTTDDEGNNEKQTRKDCKISEKDYEKMKIAFGNYLERKMKLKSFW